MVVTPGPSPRGWLAQARQQCDGDKDPLRSSRVGMEGGVCVPLSDTSPCGGIPPW